MLCRLCTLGIFCVGFAISQIESPNPSICPVVWNALEEIYRDTCGTIKLDSSRCETGINLIQNDKLQTLTRATDGSTPVFMHDSVVIKDLTDSRSIGNTVAARLERDMAASRIIEEKGYRHLIVPSSCSYEGYLIYERMPIMDRWHNEELYRDHPELFTEAIEQFTHLTMQKPLHDLDNSRFDNVAPYLVKEGDKWIGQLALVDLEHLSLDDSLTSPRMIHALFYMFDRHQLQVVHIARNALGTLKFLEDEKVPLHPVESQLVAMTSRIAPNPSFEIQEEILIYELARQATTTTFFKILEDTRISSETRDRALIEAARCNRDDIVLVLLEDNRISPQAKKQACALKQSWQDRLTSLENVLGNKTNQTYPLLPIGLLDCR